MTAPHNRRRWLEAGLVAAAAAATALAGCGSHDQPATSRSTKETTSPAPTPTSSTSPIAPSLVVPHGRIPTALVGTYTYRQVGTWHVTLRSDGTYSQWNENGQLDITGHYGNHGHLAVFSDQATDDTHGTACPAPGAYRWRFVKTELVMSVKRDDCTVGRIEQWTARWKKVSAVPLDNAPTLDDARRP